MMGTNIAKSPLLFVFLMLDLLIFIKNNENGDTLVLSHRF